MKWIDTAARDYRYALRGLRRTPVVTAVAVLSLALGTGATTAVFTLANAMLLKPLPYPEPDRLVVAFQTAVAPVTASVDTTPWSVERYQRLAELVPAFETVGFAASQDLNIRPEYPASPVERVRVEIVSASAIEALGVKPLRGRMFQPEEDEPGTPYTAGLISHRLWQRNVANLGGTVSLNGAPMTVIGVMPKSFTGFAAGADVWIPLHAMPRIQGGPRWTERLGSQVGTVIARVRDDVAMNVVDEQMKAAAQTLNAIMPERFGPAKGQWDAGVIKLQDARRHPLVRPLLQILGVAVGAVLLIVCANLAGLLLARAHARQTEIRIRLALGARRGRVARQMLTESVVLASLGVLPGLAIAYVGAEALADLRPRLPQTFVLLRGTDLLEGISLVPDWRVVAFIAGLTIIAGLGFGCVPALAAARMRTHALLSGGTSDPGKGASRGRSILVIGQVALATMLMVGAGLMGRSFKSLVESDLGFDPAGVVIMRLSSADTSAAAAARRELMLARIAALPFVEGAATQNCVPFDQECLFTMRLVAEGQTPLEASRGPLVRMHAVSADYFRVMRIPIVEGRGFGPAEERGTSSGVIISESVAHRLSRDGRSVIGRLVEARGPSAPRSEVIGVVGETKFESIEAPASPALYMAGDQSSEGPQYGAALFIRSRGAEARVIPLVSREINKADPSIAISGTTTGVGLVAAAASSTRFVAALLGGFALLAAFLAAMGIYGVLTYMVTLRAREYGIRIAVGATSGWVLADVARHGLVLVGAGLALGIAGALGSTTILSHFLYEVARVDPITYVGITILVATVGGIAALVPAWRATQVDPAVVLRD